MSGKRSDRVSPATAHDAALTARLKDVLAREWGIDARTIPDDAALNRFEKWDSLGHIGILLALSSSFGLPLNAENVQTLQSIPLIIEYLGQMQAAAGASA